MEDIKSKADVELLVNAFYLEIQKDDLIGPIFLQRIESDQWPKHLEKMTSFWNSVLFGVMDYKGNAFPPHMKLNIGTEHFDRWIKLFNEVIQSHFEGPKTQEAMIRAYKMRTMFESKLAHIKSNPNQFPIL